MTWSISEFLKRPENKFFIEIEKDWITDRFNLTDLNENIPEEIWKPYGLHYYRGMRMLGGIRDIEYNEGNCTDCSANHRARFKNQPNFRSNQIRGILLWPAPSKIRFDKCRN